MQGLEFDSCILTDVLDVTALQIEEQFQRLEEDHAIIKLIGERSLPDDPRNLRYRFVHVLYQQALYSLMGIARQRKLSRCTAEALLRHNKNNLPEVAARLGILFEVSCDYLESARYRLIAAEASVRRSPNTVTIHEVDHALDVLEKAVEGTEKVQIEFSLRIILASCFMSLYGYSSKHASVAYRKAYELGARLGRPSCLIAPLWGLWAYHITRGDAEPALRYAAETQRVAEEAGDPAGLVEACYASGITALHRAQLPEARAIFSQGLSVYESGRGKVDFLHFLFDPGVACQLHLSRALWLMGLPDSAIREASAALERAESIGHPQTIAYALVFNSLIHLMRCDEELGREKALAAIALSEGHGLSQERVWATGLYGWSLTMQGHAEQGLQLINNAMEVQAKYESRIAMTQFACLRSEALAAVGNLAAAIDVLNAGLIESEQIREHYYAAELYRLKGDYLSVQAKCQRDLIEADKCLTLAVDVASNQGARSLELRALRSRARLCLQVQTSNGAEICDYLRKLYSSFTEGYDTVDMKESKKTILSSQ
jgi:predicted ATPase